VIFPCSAAISTCSGPTIADRWLFRPEPSALANPAKTSLDLRGRLLMLAIAPGAARAVLVVLRAAGLADHVGRRQAALARRILRRRSDDRSSSFRPPQVPYFSGLPTA
jgi:hypothetical protein